MVTLESKQEIIKMHMEGLSEREITRRVKKSRNTVRKYISQFKQSKQEDVRDLPIPEEVLSTPTYKKRRSPKRVLTEKIAQTIRGYIQENEWKCAHRMHKQQMKVVDMHELLLEAGHQIGYSTVRQFVNKEITKSKEVFIRKHCKPGAEIEFDWGEVKLMINGELKKYAMAVFTLAYSNYRYARLYESETQICVMDSHVRMIEEIRFIPSVFTYDNMRTVVKSFIGQDRAITDKMQGLANYYGFHIRLCAPGKGNEKGHVERSVEFIRRKAFSSAYTFLTLEEAGRHLTATLQKLNQRQHHEHGQAHETLCEEEANAAKPAPTLFDISELGEYRVDKYSTITIRKNHYSVPEGHVGTYIKAKVGAEDIRLFANGACIAKHKRNWGLHQWEMDIYHYVNTLKQKQGALPQSECLRQAPHKIKKLYSDHYTGREKEFLVLLTHAQTQHNLDRILDAVKQLEKISLALKRFSSCVDKHNLKPYCHRHLIMMKHSSKPKKISQPTQTSLTRTNKGATFHEGQTNITRPMQGTTTTKHRQDGTRRKLQPSRTSI
ncbi:IS21 family transposase [Bacillus sp. FSL W7-1360]